MTEEQQTLEICRRICNSMHVRFTPAEVADRAFQSGIKLTGIKDIYKTDWSRLEEIEFDILATGKSTSRDFLMKNDMGAVTVAAIDPFSRQCLMIREGRPAGVLFGYSGLMDEFPTGGILRDDATGKEESLEDAALREAKQETGCTVANLIGVQWRSLESAGTSLRTMTTYISSFRIEEAQQTVKLAHGAAGEDEFIRSRLVGIDELRDLYESPDAPLNQATWGLAGTIVHNFDVICEELKRVRRNEQSVTLRDLLVADRERQAFVTSP